MVDLVRRVVETMATNAAAQAESLTSIDPTWGSQIHEIGGGWLVLAGAGMYVNRAMGVGLDTALTLDDLELIVALSASSGVAAQFEVTTATDPDTVARLRARSFAPVPDRDTTALTRPVGGPAIDGPDDIVVIPVESEADLLQWQETSALGWGHTTADARRASDAFASAVHATDAEHLVIAFDSAGKRPVGCASTTVRNGIAVLGGMSTVPAERRRGVQAALLRHRLQRAAKLGCDLAATSAAAGSASERNLLRHGFSPLTTVQTYEVATTIDS